MTESTPPTDIPEAENEDLGYFGQNIESISHREAVHEQFIDKVVHVQTPDGLVPVYDTDDQLLLDFMPELMDLYKIVMASDQEPVEEEYGKISKRMVYRLTKVGQAIHAVCKVFAGREDEGRNWQQVYVHHQFHPIIAVMWGAVIRWWNAISHWWEPTSIWAETQEEQDAVDALRKFAERVRSVCGSQAFKNILHDHERKERDNFRSACDLAIELFQQHSCLLVLRIDLYFRPDAKGWGYTDAADQAVSLYLRDLREGRIVSDFLKVIVKRENGICRGVHYHLMVFLNGHERQSAYHLTEDMGKAWQERVGADKGSYFNCYANRHRYRYNGLGKVRVDDVEKLMGLRIALWYMSKQDSVVKMGNGKRKHFWRSLMPKKRGRRGAPRKHGDGVEVVKRILGGARSPYPPGFEPPKKQAISPGSTSAASATV
jgi:hypothetical protein